MLFKSAMLMPWLAIIPTEGDVSVWAQWGLAGVVIGFVLWRDMKREDRFIEREERMRKKAEEDHRFLVETLTTTIATNTQAMEELKKSILSCKYANSALTQINIDKKDG